MKSLHFGRTNVEKKLVLCVRFGMIYVDISDDKRILHFLSLGCKRLEDFYAK